jgi:hypothetical protein
LHWNNIAINSSWSPFCAFLIRGLLLTEVGGQYRQKGQISPSN